MEQGRTLQKHTHSPYNKVSIVVSDGHHHVWDIVRSVQMALHRGPRKADTKHVLFYED